MKLIFSRKGFDSGAGGVASPILPSGHLVSLPIPVGWDEDSTHPIRFSDLTTHGVNLGDIVKGLTKNRLNEGILAHLDPDLIREHRPRQAEWHAALGQAGSSEGHLQNQGVDSGDLFLFFGWFREAEIVAGRWRFVKNAVDLHVVFGWLQVALAVPAHQEDLKEYIPEHPHVCRYSDGCGDSVYLATEELKIPGLSRRVGGAGVFPVFDDRLVLTNRRPYTRRSQWRLPRCLHPAPPGGPKRRSMLSFHKKPERWSMSGDGQNALLDLVARGQEFVLDCDDYPEVFDWLGDVFLCVPSGGE